MTPTSRSQLRKSVHGSDSQLLRKASLSSVASEGGRRLSELTSTSRLSFKLYPSPEGNPDPETRSKSEVSGKINSEVEPKVDELNIEESEEPEIVPVPIHANFDISENGDENDAQVSPTISASLEKEHFEAFPLLKQRLGYLWENRKFTDVLFKFGTNEDPVEAHKVILASGSQVFQELLYESQPLTVDGKCVLFESDYSLLAFQVFIKGFYTNEIPITLTLPMALEVFYAAKKYKVGFLQDQSLNHMRNSVTVSNVFEALRISTSMLELTFLAPICFNVIEEQTEDVLQYHLKTIDTRTFARILDRDRLNTEEVNLFQLLVKWGTIRCKQEDIRTSARNRRQFISPLLKRIRFTTMSLDDFNNIVIPTRIMESKEIEGILSHVCRSRRGPKLPVPYKMEFRQRPSKRLSNGSIPGSARSSARSVVITTSDSVVSGRLADLGKHKTKRSNLTKFRSKHGAV